MPPCIINNMESNENNWHVGEIVTLPWTSNTFKKSGSSVYKHFYSSRHVCIREADATQEGILVKVLTPTARHRISMVGGEPFCRDDVDDLFSGKAYSSFRFPTQEEVMEVLDIIRANPSLVPVFKQASMQVDTNATFWIREISRSMLLQKKPQFYDARSGNVDVAVDDTARQRLSILYFRSGNLIE